MLRSASIASAVLAITVLTFQPGCRESRQPPDLQGSDSAASPADASHMGGKDPERPKATVKPMKGLELYSWQENGETAYALLVGTNRLKDESEITAAAVKSLAEVKAALDKYEEGTEVITMRNVGFGRLTFTGITSPAEYKDLEEHCRMRGLILD